MDELEAIRQKKLEQLQQQQQQEQELQQKIGQLDMMVRQFLSKDALERLGNIKTAHPQKYMQVLSLLGHLAQSGKIQEKITDAQFKELLATIEPEKKEFKIKRK